MNFIHSYYAFYNSGFIFRLRKQLHVLLECDIEDCSKRLLWKTIQCKYPIRNGYFQNLEHTTRFQGTALLIE